MAFPSDVTEGGMIISFNEMHSSKALFPIDITDIGNETSVIKEHFLNALLPIEVTVGGMAILLILSFPKK